MKNFDIKNNEDVEYVLGNAIDDGFRGIEVLDAASKCSIILSLASLVIGLLGRAIFTHEIHNSSMGLSSINDYIKNQEENK